MAAEGLPADGVVTGTGLIDGRPVAVMANDSTVKAGSWGARTVEKIIRIIEKAYSAGIPMIYLVDSAGARITDQVDMFPGRRGAGKIFHTQVRASGAIPQVCALFGPSAAGGAYIPAFCDYVAMVDGNASMYLGSPRMVEMVVREKTTLEEMGGARMHCTVSGCGHHLAATRPTRSRAVRRYLSYLPANWQQPPPAAVAAVPDEGIDLAALVPASERQAFDMRRYVRGLVDAGSLFEIHALWAARADHRVRPAGRPGHRRGREQPDVQGRRAVRRLRGQGAPGSSSSATPSTCRCCSWPTCPASWSAPRWRGRASSGTAPR